MNNFKEKVKKQIPNAITWSRIALMVPAFISFLSGNYPLTFGLFVTSCCTDKIDGALARKFNCVSKFGARLDGFCDKVLAILGSVMTISLAGPIYAIPLALEAAIGGYNFYREKVKKQNVKTIFSGKIKTVMLYIAMSLGILNGFVKVDPLLLISGVELASSLQLIALNDYVKDDKRQSIKANNTSIISSNQSEEDKEKEVINENVSSNEREYSNTNTEVEGNENTKPMVRTRTKRN